MRWRRRARQRRQLELEQLRQDLLISLLTGLPTVILPQLEEIVHRQLMEAMTPMAQALQRQDSLLIRELRQTEAHLESLLGEVLNSLQPSMEEQMQLVDGRWTRMSSPLNLDS